MGPFLQKTKKELLLLIHCKKFQTVQKENKIWVDSGSEFYNNYFLKWLKKNDVEIYSTYNEGKSVVAERFIKVLKNKIYKHMAGVSENVYFYVLNDIDDK